MTVVTFNGGESSGFFYKRQQTRVWGEAGGMAKKQRRIVLVRTWYGATLCAPVQTGVEETATPKAAPKAAPKATPNAMPNAMPKATTTWVNTKGIPTLAADVPRPSTACFGAPLPGGSFDDMYMPRVVFVPVELECTRQQQGGR